MWQWSLGGRGAAADGAVADGAAVEGAVPDGAAAGSVPRRELTATLLSTGKNKLQPGLRQDRDPSG